MSKITERIKKTKNIRNVKIGKKTRVFLFFVFLTTILWFLNALNQEYITDIKIKVSYYNFPRNKSNISELPKNFTVSVKAYGYEIFKYQLKRKFVPLKIDLNAGKFTRLFDNDTTQFYVLTKEFKDQIESQFQGKMQIEVLKPDSLYFHFVTQKHKKVPVESAITINPAHQYIVKGDIIFIPDSVTIAGPSIFIDTIDKVFTEKLVINNEKTSINQEIKIARINGIDISPDKVIFSAEIVEYTEVAIKLQLKELNVPDSIVLHLFPSTITVYCKVGINSIDKIDASDFFAVIDYNSIKENMGEEIPVKIITYPSNIYSFYFTPEFVQYIIEKKEDYSR
jgi:hypothetical protein